MVPGNDHRCPRGVERREIVDLPLNKPKGFNLWMRTSFLANFFVEPFIVVNQKRPGECGIMWHIKLGAQWEGLRMGWPIANKYGYEVNIVLLLKR